MALPISNPLRTCTRARSTSWRNISACRKKYGSRTPTTDTWSLAQTQDEFYFSLPYHLMDLCLYGLDNAVPADKVASAAGLTQEQVHRVWQDIAAKRKATQYLHEAPLLVEPVLRTAPA